MIRYILEKKIVLCAFLAGVTILSLFFTGCKKFVDDTEYLVNMQYLKERYPFYTPDVNERYNLAIEKYQNKKLDPEPIILVTWLHKRLPGTPDYTLCLGVFDEDKDIQGIVLKEESRDPNGTVNILKEDYPFYIHDPFIDVAATYGFPVSIRKNNQGKDKKLWEDYVSMDFEYLKKQAAEYNRRISLPPWSKDALTDFSEMEEESDKIVSQWKDSLPTVWISIPEPNQKTVWIQVYDKAGNRSDFIKLIDLTRQND